jgi:hypothetical protein
MAETKSDPRDLRVIVEVGYQANGEQKGWHTLRVILFCHEEPKFRIIFSVDRRVAEGILNSLEGRDNLDYTIGDVIVFWDSSREWDEEEIDEEDKDILGPDLFISRDEDMVGSLLTQENVRGQWRELTRASRVEQWQRLPTEP